MIYVTVGTQLPFDRLVRTVDEWATHNQREDIFAQIGKTKYVPSNILWSQFLTPNENMQMIKQSSIVISHAGVGTILSALECRKPIIVMPRRFSLGEHRNDHQMATARLLAQRGLVHVAMNDNDLMVWLDKLDSSIDVPAVSPYAEDSLVTFISNFLENTFS